MFEITAEISGNEQITRDTWLMGLRCEEIPRAAKPGQFVMIRVRAGIDPLLRRPFSICGVREDAFLVLYRVVGRGTGLMARLRKGERVEVLGPLGKGFAPVEDRRSSLLVGGGIGIAPLIFFGQRYKSVKATLLAGFRSEKEILSPRRVTGEDTGFLVATDDGTEGHPGPVTDLLEMRLRQNPPDAAVYACGPKPMLQKVAQITLSLGVPCQVSLEARMACGLGVCQGCAVKAFSGSGKTYVAVCKEGPVVDVKEVDWEAF